MIQFFGIVFFLSFWSWGVHGGKHGGHKHPISQKRGSSSHHFGSSIESSKVLKISQALGNFNQYQGQKIVLEGQVKKVCEKKGCWMEVSDGSNKIRTFFADYGFTVPKHILGKNVRMQGTLEQKKVSVQKRRHYARDAGAKESEVAKIKGDQVQVQFVATGVDIVAMAKE